MKIHPDAVLINGKEYMPSDAVPDEFRRLVAMRAEAEVKVDAARAARSSASAIWEKRDREYAQACSALARYVNDQVLAAKNEAIAPF